MLESYACVYVCEPCVCLFPIEVRKGYYIIWNWGPEGCEPPCGCLEINQNPFQGWPVLLTSELSVNSCLVVFWDRVSFCHANKGQCDCYISVLRCSFYLQSHLQGLHLMRSPSVWYFCYDMVYSQMWLLLAYIND